MLGAIFIGLNVCDAYATKVALSLGATELNPVVVTWGSNLIAKGLIAAGIVLILYFFHKENLLGVINILLLGVVLWNCALCIVSEMGLV